MRLGGYEKALVTILPVQWGRYQEPIAVFARGPERASYMPFLAIRKIRGCSLSMMRIQLGSELG